MELPAKTTQPALVRDPKLFHLPDLSWNLFQGEYHSRCKTETLVGVNYPLVGPVLEAKMEKLEAQNIKEKPVHEKAWRDPTSSFHNNFLNSLFPSWLRCFAFGQRQVRARNKVMTKTSVGLKQDQPAQLG
mmetsp:Transcript_7567/g.11524  ORF Transcript_7567/g.11524 Transcript_7567/m.11524 type:complete len:130 (+) Transcript_7567:722-1111(+)